METKSMDLELYVAPEVELLEVEVEVGFAGSDKTDQTEPGPSLWD